jgi:haloacetate dehalogenase
LPERLIGADPGLYLRSTLDEWVGIPGAITADALAEYERCFDPATIHASCEDYRAGATVDLTHDHTDRGRKIRRLSCFSGAGPESALSTT